MKYYIIDAFADELFKGNPAGVCLLDKPIEDAVMQKIAFENNLAETAFLVQSDGKYKLRWFTPKVEIDLCGHATLATAFVVMNDKNNRGGTIDFETKSGLLSVTKKDEMYFLDFPSRMPVCIDQVELLENALGCKVLETHLSRDLLVVLENEMTVRELMPNFELLKQVENAFGIIVTAKGDDCDFVSRFFAPNAGVNEDSVTGSSHSTLIPYWHLRNGKEEMMARQLSTRGGTLFCKYLGERVEIGGTAICYLEGVINCNH